MRHFPHPTKEQHQEFIKLNKELEDPKFNLPRVVGLFRKQTGYYPPADLTLKIAQNCLKAKPANKWAYFMHTYKAEIKIYFANLNIQEHQKLKNEPSQLSNIFKNAGFQQQNKGRN